MVLIIGLMACAVVPLVVILIAVCVWFLLVARRARLNKISDL